MNPGTEPSLTDRLLAIRAKLSGNDFAAIERSVAAYKQALHASIGRAELSAAEGRALRVLHDELQATMRERRDEAAAWLGQQRRLRQAIFAYAGPQRRWQRRAP